TYPSTAIANEMVLNPYNNPLNKPIVITHQVIGFIAIPKKSHESLDLGGDLRYYFIMGKCALL
ncbi:MAG: hypothetical protein RLN61_03845, partial [Algiphilus sp.]